MVDGRYENLRSKTRSYLRLRGHEAESLWKASHRNTTCFLSSLLSRSSSWLIQAEMRHFLVSTLLPQSGGFFLQIMHYTYVATPSPLCE